MEAAIVDTGPLVALMDRGERQHAWAAARIAALEKPLLVCEPVLAETMYLFSGSPKAKDALWDWLESGALALRFHIGEHLPSVRALHQKYRDTPMSLADACIVLMAELFDGHRVFTLDSDFLVYRKRG